MALTEKKKIFCDEYLIDLNGTRAYKIAYPNIKNDNTAAAAASRLMKDPEVTAYIEKRMKDRQKRTEITQDWVLEELRRIADVNGSDFAKVVIKDGYPDVELIPTDELSEEKRSAISAIKQGKYGISIESYDKVKALELLGRHLGMWNDKLDINTPALDDSIKEMEEYFERRKTGGSGPPVE
ncbi:terminase small subunit [Anaerostipes faecalis]|uniref:terminase small subunit n=1 Tax=Anaerostipes faecalis TaxID=2738446 RepID=UPI003F102074